MNSCRGQKDFNHIVSKRKILVISVLIVLFAWAFFIAQPQPIFAVGTVDLMNPTTMQLQDENGVEFGANQQITLGEGFDIYYAYPEIKIEDIDFDKNYNLPDLDSMLTIETSSLSNSIKQDIYDDSGQIKLGTLTFDKTTRKTTFKFSRDTIEDMESILNFHVSLGLVLDEKTVAAGTTIKVKVPAGGEKEYTIEVVDKNKTPPTITKTGPKQNNDGTYSSFDEETNVLDWKVVVTQTGNPEPAQDFIDTYSKNQEYVAGSFKVNNVSIDDSKLNLTTKGKIIYTIDNIHANDVYTITYSTKILPTAYLDKNGVPLKSGNIVCNNTAQVFHPDSPTKITEPVKASFSRPIRWLYKTSTNVINYATGEMEWTIKIYNNGLALHNVILYDRLSPGISVMDNVAHLKIGENGNDITLLNFKKESETDLSIYDRKYNLSYDLSAYNINDNATITYKTKITNPSAYDASDHMPPNTMFDNTAFIFYQLELGNGLGYVDVVSPLVEKKAANDSRALGKNGTADKANGKVNWILTINDEGLSMKDVEISDSLTKADTTKGFREHTFSPDDLASIKYTVGGTTYNITGTNVNGRYYEAEEDSNGKIYNLKFHLGDLDMPATLTYSSTPYSTSDVATNTKELNYSFQNQSMISAGVGESILYSYSTAETPYESFVLGKNVFTDYYWSNIKPYIYDKNEVGFLLRFNENRMLLTDCFLTDVLPEGLSLTPGTVKTSEGSNESFPVNTVDIPQYDSTIDENGAYYKYNEATRTLIVHLPDVKAEDVGKISACKKVSFYATVDVDNPAIYDTQSKKYSVTNNVQLDAKYKGTPVIERASATYTPPIKKLAKASVVYKNDGLYSADYSISINGMQSTLPENCTITDVLGKGLHLDAASIRLYEGKIISLEEYEVPDKSPNYANVGKVVKADEVDASLYTYEIDTSEKDNTQLILHLPADAGKKIYVLEYSADILDPTLPEYKNVASIEGEVSEEVTNTIPQALLKAAGGGGNLVGKAGTIRFRKINADNEALSNTIFGIWSEYDLIETSEPFAQATSDSDGYVKFKDLEASKTYYIKEIKAKDKYQISDNVYVAEMNEQRINTSLYLYGDEQKEQVSLITNVLQPDPGDDPEGDKDGHDGKDDHNKDKHPKDSSTDTSEQSNIIESIIAILLSLLIFCFCRFRMI